MNPMKRIRFGIGALALALASGTAAFGQSTEAAASPLDPGRLTLGGRFGDVQEYVADALVPVWKPGRSVVFLDLRGSALETDAQELNAGLVARYLWPDRPLILGANLFYDTRWTENDNTFGQIGAGAELLSKWVDLRANYYLPVTDEKVLTESEEVSTASNGRMRTTTTTLLRTYEEALQGFDAEAGIWLPLLDKSAPTAVFAGYYRFASDFESDVSGVKFRVESRIHPNVTLDAEWYEDDELNRTDYFVGVRVHLPIDFWNGLRFDRTPGSNVRPFEARMGDMVYRDFRIRTIETGPVVANQSVEEVLTSRGSPAPAPARPAPTLPSPNCYLNAEGEVVCD